MKEINDKFVTDLIARTKAEILAQGGPRKAVSSGCNATAPTTVNYTGLAPKPLAPPNEATLRAAALALGVAYGGAQTKPAKEGYVTAPAVQRRVERVVPGVQHKVLGDPETTLRYSHKAIEKLIRADLVARGNNMAVEVGFDDLGAVVHAV